MPAFSPAPTPAYEIFPDALTDIYCSDLLEADPGRGETLRHGLRGIRIYRMNNVLCAGLLFQTLCPMEQNGGFRYRLKESWTYDVPRFPAIAARGLSLNREDGLRHLEEAAPLCQVWSNNFWHWTFEGLSRVAMLEAIGFTGNYIVQPIPFVLQSLDMLGIDPRRIVPGTGPYFVKKAVVTEHILPTAFTTKTAIAQKTLYWAVRKKLQTLPGKKRCYIRRTGNRKLLNESDVIAMLAPLGFEVMTPEDMPSVAAQFTYMTNVECSVMPHGANTTLIMAQPAGSYFFELFGKSYINHCNGPMIQIANLNYSQLVESSEEAFPFDVVADYEVNVDLLRHMVCCALHG